VVNYVLHPKENITMHNILTTILVIAILILFIILLSLLVYYILWVKITKTAPIILKTLILVSLLYVGYDLLITVFSYGTWAVFFKKLVGTAIIISPFLFLIHKLEQVKVKQINNAIRKKEHQASVKKLKQEVKYTEQIERMSLAYIKYAEHNNKTNRAKYLNEYARYKLVANTELLYEDKILSEKAVKDVLTNIKEINFIEGEDTDEIPF